MIRTACATISIHFDSLKEVFALVAASAKTSLHILRLF